MRRLLGEQVRLLHRGCKILVFQFNFELKSEYKVILDYNNEMNKEDVPDDKILPVCVQVHNDTIFFRFKPYGEDRAYQTEIWSEDDGTIPLEEQLDDMISGGT